MVYVENSTFCEDYYNLHVPVDQGIELTVIVHKEHCMFGWCLLYVMCDFGFEWLKPLMSESSGGVCSTVVEHWTAGQQVSWSIIHQGHISQQNSSH